MIDLWSRSRGQLPYKIGLYVVANTECDSIARWAQRHDCYVCTTCCSRICFCFQHVTEREKALDSFHVAFIMVEHHDLRPQSQATAQTRAFEPTHPYC